MLQKNVKVNRDIVKRFSTLFKKERLAHAYLFSGSVGSGKTQTAIAIAKLVNCANLSDDNNIFCDECPACLKINSGNHADVHLLDNDYGEAIKIDQVRGVLSQVKLRPFESTIKVFIIRNIEGLTIEAANALLKTLEEPSNNSLLLLTTAALDKNLDTIKSRCHAVYFPLFSKAKLKNRLVENYKANEDSHFLAYFSEGCLGKVQKFKEDKIFIFKNSVVDNFILSQGDDAFLKKILENKQKTKIFLDILLGWVRDSMLLKLDVEDECLINLDRLRELKKFEVCFSFEELLELEREVVNMYKMFMENLNIKIPLMVLKERLWKK
ncbi:MAG: DNA polymerase III subunit delta' C-terminal domain-containing protein [Candidatus Zapsychrus exili]|nr:DNA polymerase III subunit delta' C-terminal domain-containing protein [Candidatus Zapsychrus exili]